MIGTVLNALAIVGGTLAGLLAWSPISEAGQRALKILLGVFTIWIGLSSCWQAVWSARGHGFGVFGLAVLSLMLGHATGRLLRLQTHLNRLGQYARDRFAGTDSRPPRAHSEGFLACAILFAATPLAVLGALLDGLNGNWQFLAAKAVMDGLSATAFARVFGYSVALSVVPVVAVQGTVTLLASALAQAAAPPETTAVLGAAAGLLVFTVSLVILDLKKVGLADYLPTILWAPALGWLIY